MMRSSGSRLWAVALVAGILMASPVLAATRPVSIGLNANWEQWLSRSANVGWVRIDIVWSVINPSPGAWDFTQPDAQVNESVANGQQVLGILHYAPAWVGGGSGNIPPLSTAEWAEFVRRVSQRYAGRIAAYEIWNEPDQKSTSHGGGIGWGRNIEEPPLYVDFVRAAAREIRTYAPGTQVVAPAFLSRNDADGADNRKKRILQQIQWTSYPDGPGHSFVDAISFHNNASHSQSTASSRTMGHTLNYQNLAYVYNHAPSLVSRPVWVTEFGWMSNSVGEAGQREKICNLLKIYTGLLEAGYTDLDFWDVRRAFIFVQKADSSSASIFRPDYSPKPVVTQYLQRLSYPAVQNPAFSAEFPACSGSTAASMAAASGRGAADIGRLFAALSLRDPRAALPPRYRLDHVEGGENGRGLETIFSDGAGSYILISVAPAGATRRPGSMTELGAHWRSGENEISVSTSGTAGDHGLIRAIAAAVDPAFGRGCLVESLSGDASAVARFGLSAPSLPPGFARVEENIEFTRPSKACAESVRPVLDFVWTFREPTGGLVRAGIYRYENSFDSTVIGASSWHWAGKGGTRYWVAAESEMTPELEESLDRIARSMDRDFQGRRP